MGLQRLAIATPNASTPTTLFTADTHYLFSVIAANTSGSATVISIWIEPTGAAGPNQYAYMIHNFPLDSSNSYETFRFALNPDDAVRVEAGSGSVSFHAHGLVQHDVRLKVGTSTWSAAAPAYPITGMIWVDADGTVPNNSSSKPTYVYDGDSWIPMSAAQPTLEPAHLDIIIAQRIFV